MSSRELNTVPEPYPAPPVLRFAGAVSIFQAVVAYIVGIYLIVQDFRTLNDSGSLVSESAAVNWVGTGTAVFIFIVFGASLFAGINLFRDKAWGRGAVVLLEILLLFVAFYMLSGQAWAAGIATGLSAILIMVGYFHPQSTQWFADAYLAKHYR